MKFSRDDADLFVPDGAPMPAALARTTHLCVAAHQDDQEYMAYHGIAECFGRDDKWFTGVVVTDGAGSPRGGPYADLSDARMMAVRRREQRKAAVLGEYACQIQLFHPSAAVKDPHRPEAVADLRAVLETARPEVVYVHNPADKHDTHVACCLRAIAALRALPPDARPRKVYGCEFWRSLDWLVDQDKQALDVDRRRNMAAALTALFDSQITGGKRYDTAVLGRQAANATFFESHGVDQSAAPTWALDLTPLAHDASLAVADYTLAFVERLRADVADRLGRLGG